MKVCIVGAGAIGGFLGVRLGAVGSAEVSVLARGATLEALRKRGWRLRQTSGELKVPVRAAADAAALGRQDLVIIAVKGPALAQVAGSVAQLIDADSVVMPAMNGVPWWFCEEQAGFGPGALRSVDPGGAIAAAIPFARVIGCVVHANAAVAEPGFVHHRMGQGLIIGEPRGGHTARAQRVADLLTQAGFEVTHSTDVRRDIWYKLWGNLTMNPVSAVTGATIDRVLGDAQLREFCSAAMLEAAAIGARIGCPIDQNPEDRHAITAKLGAFKTSMLQDVEAGRGIELDVIVTAVHEIGARLSINMPSISALLGLTRVFAQVHGLYPETTSGGGESPEMPC